VGASIGLEARPWRTGSRGASNRLLNYSHQPARSSNRHFHYYEDGGQENSRSENIYAGAADYSVSNSKGTTLSYFGYEFEVPWNASFKQKASGKGGLVQLQFDSGQSVTFIVPANQGGLLTEIVQDGSLKMGDLQVVFGDLMNRSAYDQYGALLNTTPRSIRAFGPRGEAVRGVTLLTIKAIAFGPGLETGAFSFELPGKHGFQIGDPQKSKRVELEVFDSTGQHIEILCGTTNSSVRFSQSELNRILTSLHSTTGSAHLTALQN
jgi:hypothetical protein